MRTRPALALVVLAALLAGAAVGLLLRSVSAPGAEPLASTAASSTPEAGRLVASDPRQDALRPPALPPPAPLRVTAAGGKPPRLQVLALTADGEPLAGVVQSEWPDAPALSVFASHGAIPDRIRSEWFGGPRSIARFEPQPAQDPAQIPGHIGWLTLGEALPMQAALRLGDNVLARTTVELATQQVCFVLPLEAASGFTGSVRGRVVRASADRGAVAGALVALEPTDFFPIFGGRHLVDADGRFRIERVPFGEAFVRVDAARCERIVSRIDVPRGAELDLGEIVLGEGRPLRGRVMLPDGSPASNARLAIRPEADSRRPMDSPPNISTDFAREDGRFSLGPLGRRRYWLHAAVFCFPGDDRSHLARVQIDAEPELPAELLVTMLPSVRVSLDGVETGADVSELSITDADGCLVWSAGPDELESDLLVDPLDLQMLPGRYTIRLVRAGRPVWSRELDVGTDPLTATLP